MKSQNTALIPVLLVNFIGALGFSLVLPFLVFVVKDFGGNEIIYGIMGAVYPTFQLIGAPILGSWSDKFGRRKILLLSQAGTLVAWIVFLAAFFLPINTLFSIENELLGKFVFTLPLLILFLARALDGITGGNVSFRFVVDKIDVISYLVFKNSSSRKRTYETSQTIKIYLSKQPLPTFIQSQTQIVFGVFLLT